MRKSILLAAVIGVLTRIGWSAAYGQIWIPYVPTPNQTAIQVWPQDSAVRAKVIVSLPDSCRELVSWGSIQRSGNEITIGSTFRERTDTLCYQMVHKVENVFELGALDPGSYILIFTASGQTVKTDQFIVANPAASGITAAKASADNTLVEITGSSISASDYYQLFYIESASRSQGIRVLMPGNNLSAGSTVDVAGRMATDPDGERYLEAYHAVSTGAHTLKPLGLAVRELGGEDFLCTTPGTGQKGVAGGKGLNNIGLYIKTWGKVTYVGDNYFCIDDGSALDDGAGNPGMRVLGGLPGCPQVHAPGRIAEVTGISSCYKSGDNLYRLILATNVSLKTNVITTSSGLKYEEIVVGTGDSPQTGDTAVVDYTLWLDNCMRVDSSEGRQPLEYTVGGGQVIAGFEEGVAGMKVGGKRLLTIPPELGYGAVGMPPIVPPYATLTMEVELLMTFA